MNTISFMSANYVARVLGYRMTDGWGQGERATSDRFSPLDTFGEAFDEILRDARGLGFEAVDLWTAHLDWRWATDDHLSAARELLARHGLAVASLAGSFGATPEEFEAACRVARAVGAPVLGGFSDLLAIDRSALVGLLYDYDLRFGIENHPEKHPREIEARIGDGAGGRIGATIDTGWYGTQGYDAALAIEQLAEHVVHVHLKDVYSPGAHVTCAFGEGCVPLHRCVQALESIGYEGAASVEHEPEDHDPTEECRRSLSTLRGWLQDTAGARA
ncbi:MAG: sugar phosphate isomerase/epimerase family protein [Actinomycetota bacterium]